MTPKRAGAGFRPDIQGLRAVAVLVVVLYHANLPSLTGGFVGVDIFFVISGYLITGHIVQGLAGGSFGFATFYANRIRRIIPASIAVLIVSLTVAWLIAPPLQLARISRDAAWTALYIPNLLFAREGTNYLASPEPSLFQHYWSLGIEEQFYLLWPLILWAIFRISRRNMNVVFTTMTILVLLSFTGSVLLTPLNQPWAFFLLPTRAWELGVGGILAFLAIKRRTPFPSVIKNLGGGIALVVLIGTAFTFDSGTPFPSYYAAVPVVATAVVIYFGPYTGVVGVLLQNRAALWIGAISYSVYLVHWPVLILPQITDSWMEPLSLTSSLMLAALSIPLGWLSYRLIETPFRKRRSDKRKSVMIPLSTGLAFGIVVATVAVVGMRSIATVEMDAGRPAPEFNLTTYPVSPPFVGSNLSVRLQDFQSEMSVPSGSGCDLSSRSDQPPPGCTYGSDPAALAVALVGDSHAAQWAPAFEAIAAEGDIFLTAHTKSACALHNRSVADGVSESAVCLNWKSAVIEILNEEPPDVIVLTHSVQSKPISADAYQVAMTKLLSELPEETQVVLLRDTPRFQGDPMSCLSKYLESPERCSIPRGQAIRADFEAVDDYFASYPGVSQMDMTDYLCADMCPLIQGNVLVFKDQQHISRTFAREAAPAVSAALNSALE